MKIKYYRKQKGITQKELANRIGATISLISKYESGAVTPTISKLHKIADVLEVPFQSLFDDTSTETENHLTLGSNHSTAESPRENSVLDSDFEAASTDIKIPIETTTSSANPDLFHKRMMAYTEKLIHMKLINSTNGRCEYCGAPAPFFEDGAPYLELAHLSPTDSDTATEMIKNVVVMCPNCHAQIARLKDPEDLKKLRNIAANHSPNLLLQ